MVLLRERTRPGLGIVEPCLPSPAKAPPSGPGWLHEIKHDGFRISARRDSTGARLITRAGNDFSSRFPFIAMAVGKLAVRSCLIDGDIIEQTLRNPPIMSVRTKADIRSGVASEQQR